MQCCRRWNIDCRATYHICTSQLQQRELPPTRAGEVEPRLEQDSSLEIVMHTPSLPRSLARRARGSTTIIILAMHFILLAHSSAEVLRVPREWGWARTHCECSKFAQAIGATRQRARAGEMHRLSDQSRFAWKLQVLYQGRAADLGLLTHSLTHALIHPFIRSSIHVCDNWPDRCLGVFKTLVEPNQPREFLCPES